MTSGLQQRAASPPDDGASAGSRGTRAAGTAQVAAKVAVASAVVLALWLLANWLAGADHVATVSAGTVDGGTIGRVLAFLTWATMTVALGCGVVAARQRGADSQAGSDATGAVDAVDAHSTAHDVTVARLAGRVGTRRARWTGVGLVGVGAVFVIATYHGLLLPGAITWGDWGYFVNAGAVRDYFPVPSLWSFATLGSDNILGASLAPIESVMGIMARLGVPYSVLERLWFYFPAVALSYTGPVILARRLHASWPVAAGVGAFYSVNPYALVLISGGQLTVGVGYALFPWVALAALRLWSRRTAGAGLLLGGLVGVQAWCDPRTAGLSIAGLVLALLVLAASGARPAVRQLPWAGAVAAGVVFVLLQGPWLLPALLAVRAHLPAGYTTAGALATFSLLSLADGITGFHPFWPTMHFIVLYSVPALWLIVPVTVAVSLVRDPCDRRVHVGGALYLVFAALLSGANPPFGFVNTWLFTHVPGMDLFRDPSPYLGPIALGVVVVAAAPATWRRTPADRCLPGLSAATTSSSSMRSEGALWCRAGHHAGNAAGARSGLVFVASVLVVVSAWPALSGALHHDLAPGSVPARYVQVDRAIMAAPPGAVLWVPSTSRFAPVSPEHPSVSAFALESTSGVAFPPVVQGMEWLSVPSLVEMFVQRYDIHTIVLRENPTVYKNLSLPFRTTRGEARSTFGALPDVSETALPGLAVFGLRAASGYPVAVFHQPVATVVPSQRRSPIQPGTTASRARQELAHRSFSDGLVGWGAVGDGNDYLHQTLGQAGITASVQGEGSRSWLHLTVRYGAASISQSLATCPAPGLQELRVRYRTSAAASVAGLVFSAAQPPPVGEVSLPATQGRWVTTSVPFVLAPTLDEAARRVPLTGCELVLSAQPAVAGTSSSADVASLSLEPATIAVSASVADTVAPAARWVRPTRASAVHMIPTGDSTTLTVPAGPHARLVVFWQRYNPGWVARTGGGATLRHVEVDGWANGFIVPTAKRSVHLDIQYTPQRLSADGFDMVLAGFAVLISGGLFAIVRRWSRASRTRVGSA